MTMTSEAARRAAQLYQAQKLDEAAELCQQILRDRADDALALHVLGLVHYQRQEIEAAGDLMRRSLAVDGSRPMWHYHLAVVDHQTGRLEAAAAGYRRTLAGDSRCAAAHNNLGAILLAQKRTEPAADCFRRALQCDPDHVDAHANLSAALVELGQLDEAVTHIRRAIRLRPKTANYHQILGDALRLQQHLSEAEACYQRALALDPKLASAHQHLGLVYREQGRMRTAEESFRRAAAADPNWVPARRALAVVLKEQGDLDGAMAAFEDALALAPDDPDTVAAQVGVLEMRSEYDLAWQRLEPLVKAETTTVNVATAFAAVSGQLRRSDQAVDLIERLLAQGRLHVVQRVLLHFSCGKLLDELHRYDAAFGHFGQANRHKPRQFDAAGHATFVDRMIRAFSRSALADLPRASRSSSQPVFIVGMPRSGTTLAEQIVSSHPDVHGAGERHELLKVIAAMPKTLRTEKPYPQCIDGLTVAAADELADRYLQSLQALSPEALRVTDKLPLNAMHLGLICLLFPQARIIHCVRDARDTCLSCYFQNFAGRHSYAYDLHDLGSYYRHYERLMAHWEQVVDVPRLTVRYEELVSRPDPHIRELIAFCGLKWDDRCLRFYQTQRDVTTASYGQVRQPIYQSSVGRWRHYEKHLGPLLEGLGDSKWLSGKPLK